MKKKSLNISTYILCTMISILFYTCTSNHSSETEKQDSLKTVVKTPTVSNGVTKYSINPPDTDYTGDYIDKYPSGVIKFSGFFRFGKRHGQWMAFYENGRLWSECFYNEGKREGASNVYYPNSKPHYKGWFKNDLRDSVWLFFDTTGTQIDKRAFLNDQETVAN